MSDKLDGIIRLALIYHRAKSQPRPNREFYWYVVIAVISVCMCVYVCGSSLLFFFCRDAQPIIGKN